MAWWFRPEYRITIEKGVFGKVPDSVYLLRSLTQLETSVVVAGGVNQLNATFSDPGRSILRDKNTAPHAMDTIRVQAKNRYGVWGPVWLGLIDTVHSIGDPQSGYAVQISATGPVKLWEIISQTPGDVFGLAFAYAAGIPGTAVLAQSIKAVGYPPEMMTIDPLADSGVFLWGQLQANAINPDQAKWSAIISQIQSDSGLEWFFDEEGKGHWRRVGYLQTTSPSPRPINPDDVIHYDTFESDQGISTYIEVRWGSIPALADAAFWNAPATMTKHLGTRVLVIYSPWLRNLQGAQFLATTLGQQIAANVLLGSITIPCDPTFRAGTLCGIPIPGARGTSLKTSSVYYVNSVVQNWQWGGAFTTTLGLSYGRDRSASFPYDLKANYPVTTPEVQAAFSMDGKNTIPFYSQQNLGLPTAPVNATQISGIDNNSVRLDPKLNIPVGSIVIIRDSTGIFAGGSTNGEYTVVDGSPPAGFSVAVSSPIPKYVQVYPVQFATTPGQSTTGSGGGQDDQVPKGPVPFDTTLGKDIPTPAAFPTWPLTQSSAANITQHFGTPPELSSFEPANVDCAGNHYDHYHTGIDISNHSGSDAGTAVVAATDCVISGIVETIDCPNSYIDGVQFCYFGYTVVTRAGDYTIHYSHLISNSCPYAIGSSLKAGMQIGVEGSTGNSTGTHLHFGVFSHQRGCWIDPLLLLAGGG